MTEDTTNGKVWTEEERLALASKLDAELDEFIESLEKKRYSEGWPEDRWQEEMEKHPFFMKKTPQPGDEVHPMFEGLQKLKYDPEENTKEELALNYKDDGNFYLKHKKYRMAVYSYGEGLKVKCENPEVQAILYNNRSAAQYFLQNYRSALEDAQKALQLKPNYEKCEMRAAKCAFKLKKFDICTKLCLSLIEKDPNNEKAKELLKSNKLKKLEDDRNERKEVTAAKKRLEEFERLRNALVERGVEFDDLKSGQSITEEFLKPKFHPLEDHSVHFDEDDPDVLVWPVAFSYPEFLFTDFQQQVSENVTLSECIETLLKEQLDCDANFFYRPDTVNVYYENRKEGTVYRAHLDKTIKIIVEEERFCVTGGALLFYIVSKDTRSEMEFLQESRHPMTYS